jgi:hypothetical protein
MAITISGSGIVEANIANGAVTNAKLATNSVDSSELVNGAVDDSHLATGIDATKLADGTITNSELQYINSLSSNAQTQIDGVGGGKLGQIVVGEDNTRTDLSSTTYADVGLSVSITPTANSSSVFIMFNMHARVQSDEGYGMKLLRGSTGIWESTTNTHAFQYQANDVRLTPTVFYLDSGISTTSATTYKIQVATMSSKTVDFNISNDKTQIVAIEILA